MLSDIVRLSNYETYLIGNDHINYKLDYTIKYLDYTNEIIYIHTKTGIIDDPQWELVSDMDKLAPIINHKSQTPRFTQFQQFRIGTKLVILLDDNNKQYCIFDNVIYVICCAGKYISVYRTNSITYYNFDGTILTIINGISDIISKFNCIKDGYIYHIMNNTQILQLSSQIDTWEYIAPQLYKFITRTNSYYVAGELYIECILPNITECKIASNIIVLQSTEGIAIINKYGKGIISESCAKINTIYAITRYINSSIVHIYAKDIYDNNTLIVYNFANDVIISLEFNQFINTRFGTLDVISRTYICESNVITDVKTCKYSKGVDYVKVYLYETGIKYTKNARC